jgi:antitoxin component HigA of HigAB toxin-antitoxin module
VPEGAPSRDPKAPASRVDIVTMEREAKEMAALASSVPGDIEQLRKGILPSSTLEKLKKIEKLSKQLRNRIRP